MSLILVGTSENVATLNGAALSCCRILLTEDAYLENAESWAQNIVTTGTVTVKLMTGFAGDAAGGSILDTLTNADLGDVSSIITKFTFTLDDATLARLFPKDQMFWLLMTGDNAADRYDKPVLKMTFKPKGEAT